MENLLLAARQQRNFEEKSSSQEQDLQWWLMYFQLIKNQSLRHVFFDKCLIDIQHYCGCITIFYPWKWVKTQSNEREIGCF